MTDCWSILAAALLGAEWNIAKAHGMEPLYNWSITHIRCYGLGLPRRSTMSSTSTFRSALFPSSINLEVRLIGLLPT